jgi:hypothetical protein
MSCHVTGPGSAGIEQHQQLPLRHSSARCFDHSQGSRQAPARLTLIFLSVLRFASPIMSASPAASNSSFSMSAYMVPSTQNPYSSPSDDDVASLPSEATTDSDLDTLSDDFSDAEAEWRESLDQLELLLTMVLVPFVGKYLGRRCAYWGRQPWSQFLFISHTNQLIRSQVGRGSWNGNTPLRWS